MRKVYFESRLPLLELGPDPAVPAQEPERTNDFGLRYCWVLWELEVAVEDLAKTPEIAVRRGDLGSVAELSDVV